MRKKVIGELGPCWILWQRAANRHCWCSFYYADQRTPEGDSVMQNVSGEAHGDFLIELASKKEQGPWQATFVKGKGYVKM